MKQDPKLVSQEKYEVKYIAAKFKVPASLVRKVQKEVGRSRRKVYKRIREILADGSN